jgi:hypothetical protein
MDKFFGSELGLKCVYQVTMSLGYRIKKVMHIHLGFRVPVKNLSCEGRRFQSPTSIFLLQ